MRKLGFDVARVRVGRVIDVEFEATAGGDAHAEVERMCSELLANPLIESVEVSLEER